MPDTGTPVTTLARERMNKLYEAATSAYKDRRLIRAAGLYKQALAIAEDLNDNRKVIQYRMWAAAALYETGKLNSALQEILPTLQQDYREGAPADIYNTYIRYIDIAQDLPVSLAAVEKVMRQAGDFLMETGHLDWRHMILLSEADLLFYRGRFPEALKKARESWSCYGNQYPRFILDEHLNRLTRICLYLADAPCARQYLAEWERQKENNHPKWREINMGECQSRLARLEKRKGEAVEWARRADFTAQQTDHPLEAAVTLVEAFLANGEAARVSPLLNRLRETRGSESLHDRYDFYRLLGDTYLARARQAAGMKPVDETFDHEFPAPIYIKDIKSVQRETRRARGAYDRALSIGSRIDSLLECTIRQEEIARRSKRLQAIENQCKKHAAQVRSGKADSPVPQNPN